MTLPMEAATPPEVNKCPLWFVAVGLMLPSIVTWIYFVTLATHPESIQKLAVILGKGIQCVLPIIAYTIWLRQFPIQHESSVDNQLALERDRKRYGLGFGIVSGLIIAGIIFLCYRAWLLPMGVLEIVREEGQKKLDGFGINSPFAFVLLGVFYSLLHSGFEEFYWRRFVFLGLTQHTHWRTAACISSLGFMSHHVIVLAKYFGWNSPYCYLCSVGVAVGGALWAWMLWRTKSIVPCWISHGIVDAAIFVVGYDLLFQ